ncbi:MAG: hypothetical protein JSV60_03980, partial [Desulfobacterales bacterium]
GLLSEAQIDSLEEEIKAEIKEAEERFDEQAKKLGDPLDMFNHAFADLPPTLVEQKDEVSRNLSAK